VKKISCPQAGETGANDHNRLVGIERTRGDASNRSGERKRSCGLLKKSSAIHVLPFVRRDAVLSETAASWADRELSRSIALPKSDVEDADVPQSSAADRSSSAGPLRMVDALARLAAPLA
jgi:hypothetical protein